MVLPSPSEPPVFTNIGGVTHEANINYRQMMTSYFRSFVKVII